MKKLKLKGWVKVTLIIFILAGLINIINNQYLKAVEQCVSAGHSRSYCENGLK